MNASNYGIKKAQTMNIEVSDEVGLHLKELAEERELTVEELIRAMLDRYDGKRRKGLTLADPANMAIEAGFSSAEPDGAADNGRDILKTEYAKHLLERGYSPSEVVDVLTKEYPPGSLARFAQIAIKAGMASKEPVDTSANSREILNTEYADYLKQRRASCP